MFDQQTPLSIKLRPDKFIDIIGQDHLVGNDGIFTKMVKNNKIQNILLWGPPGSGKTTIAYALSKESNIPFRKLNATTSGIKELREIIKFAENSNKIILAVDEIHRWSKNVQDALLNAVENGIIILVGLTVETAKFAVIKALLSRCLVLETKPLTNKSLVILYKKVKNYYKDQGKKILADNETVVKLINRANGDARKIIMVLETLIEIMSDDGRILENDLDLVMPNKNLFFDSSGAERYDNAHCYQEAIQHSDVDGAIYWLAKWVASGEDPAYICRRMLITAFEDCAGNPFAATTAMAAAFATERIGLPECMIPMSLATCEMATSVRNKSAYYAISEAMADVENGATVHVPPGLRAGTTGYVKAVEKTYLKGWYKDWDAIQRASALKDAPENAPEDGRFVYAIGIKDKSGHFGMMYGPTPNLNDMLDHEGEEGYHIIQFNGEKDEPIFRWDGEQWLRIK